LTTKSYDHKVEIDFFQTKMSQQFGNFSCPFIKIFPSDCKTAMTTKWKRCFSKSKCRSNLVIFAMTTTGTFYDETVEIRPKSYDVSLGIEIDVNLDRNISGQ